MPEVLVDELVRAVLEDAVVAKAREVQAGGPHKLLRAIELAEMVEMVGMMEKAEAGNGAKVGRA